MKLTVISDIHDNITNLRKALGIPALQATEAMLCCGDLCSPFVIKLLGQAYGNPIHIVLGNNDGDLAAIIQTVKGYGNIHVHGEYFHGVFGGKTIAMNHYPEKAEILAASGMFDVVCYGHNHQLERDRKVRGTLLLNPGTLMGFHGGELKEIQSTFILLDLPSMKTEVCRV